MVAQHVTVTGRNMDVGQALTEYVRSRMEALSEKYFGRLVTCNVVFTKNSKGIAYGCHIGVTVGASMHYDGSDTHNVPHQSFEGAYEHVAKQLRRAKRALHEDKPNGHMKERVLQQLSSPEPDEPLLDVPTAAEAIQKMYR